MSGFEPPVLPDEPCQTWQPEKGGPPVLLLGTGKPASRTWKCLAGGPPLIWEEEVRDEIP